MLNPYMNNPTNKEMVDRMLGIAYERVKKVHEHLDIITYIYEHYQELSDLLEGNTATLDALTEAITNVSNNGIFVGKDMGIVGQDDPDPAWTGESWIASLTKNWSYIPKIYEEIDNIRRNGIYIQDIITVAAIADAVSTTANLKTDIEKVNSQSLPIKICSANIENILILADKISELLALKDAIPNLSLIEDNLSALKRISQHVRSLSNLSENIDVINEALNDYQVFLDVLNNIDTIKEVAKHVKGLEFVETHGSELDTLVQKADTLEGLLKYVDDLSLISTHITDIHAAVDNLELIKKYSDLSDKIHALYDGLYPMEIPANVVLASGIPLQNMVDTIASGSKITLSEDLTESVTIPTGKTITIDLNGYTLTNTANKDTFTVEFGAILYLKGNGGTVDNTSNNRAALFNKGYAVIDNCILTKSTGEYYAILNHGRMVLNSGVTVRLKPTATSSCVVNGYYDYNNSTNERLGFKQNNGLAYPRLYINHGTYSGGLNTIKNDDGGQCFINGGEISNSNPQGCCVFNVHEMRINYTKVLATNAKAIYNRWYDDHIDRGQLNIYDGIFTGSVNQFDKSHGFIKIYGGTFDTDVSEFRES